MDWRGMKPLFFLVFLATPILVVKTDDDIPSYEGSSASHSGTVTAGQTGYVKFRPTSSGNMFVEMTYTEVPHSQRPDPLLMLRKGALPTASYSRNQWNWDLNGVDFQGYLVWRTRQYILESGVNAGEDWYVGILNVDTVVQNTLTYSVSMSVGSEEPCPQNCFGRGTCEAGGVCSCIEGWGDADCNTEIGRMNMGSETGMELTSNVFQYYEVFFNAEEAEADSMTINCKLNSQGGDFFFYVKATFAADPTLPTANNQNYYATLKKNEGLDQRVQFNTVKEAAKYMFAFRNMGNTGDFSTSAFYRVTPEAPEQGIGIYLFIWVAVAVGITITLFCIGYCVLRRYMKKEEAREDMIERERRRRIQELLEVQRMMNEQRDNRRAQLLENVDETFPAKPYKEVQNQIWGVGGEGQQAAAEQTPVVPANGEEKQEGEEGGDREEPRREGGPQLHSTERVGSAMALDDPAEDNEEADDDGDNRGPVSAAVIGKENAGGTLAVSTVPSNVGGSPGKGGDEEEPSCPICLVEFDEKDLVRLLTCRHCYHKGCIDEWFKSNSNCPLCKRDYAPDASPEAGNPAQAWAVEGGGPDGAAPNADAAEQERQRRRRERRERRLRRLREGAEGEETPARADHEGNAGGDGDGGRRRPARTRDPSNRRRSAREQARAERQEAEGGGGGGWPSEAEGGGQGQRVQPMVVGTLSELAPAGEEHPQEQLNSSSLPGEPEAAVSASPPSAEVEEPQAVCFDGQKSGAGVMALAMQDMGLDRGGEGQTGQPPRGCGKVVFVVSNPDSYYALKRECTTTTRRAGGCVPNETRDKIDWSRARL
uniref:RING-type domain-containing protein n=1 Tax=Chromera velia CCMP2878 TaxID=1169474 RepID=A0A0G4HKR2_9ALVE|eukprot:Cvel_7251.t1-p1 / transcript=Cvel_7251.t1 / gene=Cvel_7251 / organism=Chromera_velia_CCMP2878 / gene_product=RING-H2 finger protein ATL46, putative / transcript_product=RING-H2 finger protein ATL46, putative / location=Cvel_scaffold374:39672-50916(+) / protein_length=820 / sequence_SO=supercontig / SO=protein_coding / is_pseudo=false